MCLHEITILKPQSARKTDHELFGQGLTVAHEGFRLGFEAGKERVGDPHAGHVGPELELVGFLLVGGAGGRTDLRGVFPADVLGAEGDGGFGRVREGEEGAREGEHRGYGGRGDAVGSEGEEATVGGLAGGSGLYLRGLGESRRSSKVWL